MNREQNHINWAKQMKKRFPDILSKFEISEIVKIWEEYSESFAAGWLSDDEEIEVKRVFNEIIMTDKQLKVVDTMENYGGSFVKALAKCYYRADPINFAKLQNAFLEYWEKYEKMADEE